MTELEDSMKIDVNIGTHIFSQEALGPIMTPSRCVIQYFLNIT